MVDKAEMKALLEKILLRLGNNPMQDDELAAEIRTVLNLEDGELPKGEQA